jgi:hypothetical protein
MRTSELQNVDCCVVVLDAMFRYSDFQSGDVRRGVLLAGDKASHARLEYYDVGAVDERSFNRLYSHAGQYRVSTDVSSTVHLS